MIIPISKIIVKDRIRKDYGDIKELANDIRDNGLINPPVINKDYVLLAGERRLRACKSLGWKQIPVTMMDTRDAEHELNIEISENDVRKDFSKAERVDYMKRLLRIEQEKAKKRHGARNDILQKFAESERGNARDKAAASFGVSGETARKEMAIVDNKDLLTPDDFANWDEGRLSTNKAYQKIKAKLASAEDALIKAKEDKEREVEHYKKLSQEVMHEYPADYEKVKREAKQAEGYRQDFLDMRNRYNEMAEKWKKAETDKAELQKIITAKEDAPIEEIRNSSLVFCAGISKFIERYGGYIWLTTRLNDLPEYERKGFVEGVNALDAWVKQMKTNMEGHYE